MYYDNPDFGMDGSPSSRRAWIEMYYDNPDFGMDGSPSSRRAWIEICRLRLFDKLCYVALLAEGVDRNRETATAKPTEAGRPPRGGRG